MNRITADIDFIEAIALAQDGRLITQRPLRASREEGVRRGESEAVEPEMDARAAVNARSVMSFSGDATAHEKDDVLYSTQLAQRAASAQHDRYTDAEAWYRVYVEVLERLGWVDQGLAFKKMGARVGDFTMDKAALDVIAEIATGGQLAILVKALDSLRALASDREPIRVFEIQAMNELGGNFQLGSVQRSENGALALALGAFHFRSTNTRGGLLFWKWGDEKVDFWTAAQAMTLNGKHYARLRSTVRKKLGEEASGYLVALEVA